MTIQTNFNITLTEEAAAVLIASATERKKGEWLSDVIVRCAQETAHADGMFERMEKKLDRIEKLLLALTSAREG